MKKLALMTIILMLAVLIVPVSPVGASPDQETLRPNGVGSFTSWTAFGAPTNWECVNESVSDNDSTYVTTSGNNIHDSYNLQDHTTGSGTISNVRVYARAKSLTAGKILRLTVVIDGIGYEGADITLTDAYADSYYDWAQNPFTLAAWTWAEIDALEAGFRNTVAGKIEHRVTTVWVVVDYTPALPDIVNTPSEWDLGTVVADSTYQTGLDYFTITNNSSYNVTISIHGEDMAGTGADWILSNLGNPGTNTYGLMAGRPDLGNYTIIVKRDLSYNTLVSNLAASANQSWGLQFFAPTAPLPDYETSKSANVTLTATQAGG